MTASTPPRRRCYSFLLKNFKQLGANFCNNIKLMILVHYNLLIKIKFENGQIFL